MARKAHTILALVVLFLAMAGTVRCTQDFQAEDEDHEEMHRRNVENFPDEDQAQVEKDAAELKLDDTDCDVGNWGVWSECSSRCGKGTMTRSRKLKIPGNAKACDWLDTVQIRNCNDHDCSKEEMEAMRSEGTYQTIVNIIAIGGVAAIVIGCVVHNLPKRKY